MISIPEEIERYHRSGKPLSCELNVQPWICEFWPFDQLSTYNKEYEVEIYAPGYFGFATNGGGEMFAVSPEGSIVYLPFIGMEPKVARKVSDSWPSFEEILRNAL